MKPRTSVPTINNDSILWRKIFYRVDQLRRLLYIYGFTQIGHSNPKVSNNLYNLMIIYSPPLKKTPWNWMIFKTIFVLYIFLLLLSYCLNISVYFLSIKIGKRLNTKLGGKATLFSLFSLSLLLLLSQIRNFTKL